MLVITTDVYARNRTSVKRYDVEDTSYKLILIEELNIYNSVQYLNNYFQYFDNHWNVGIQSTNVKISGISNQSFENDSYINGSYTYEIYDDIDLEVGGQIGTNFDNNVQKLHTYDFVDLSTELIDEMFIHVGGYYVNDELATIHQPFNYQTGIKYKHDDIIITIDYYSGHNNVSGSIVNGYYQLTDNFRPYIGVQFSNFFVVDDGMNVNIGFSLKLN